MRLALITTTLKPPRVLELYQAHARRGYHAEMYVAGDVSTLPETADWCAKRGIRFLPYAEQEERWPELSKLIGPRTVARRNFALLAALNDGAEIVVTVDDDNFPLDASYFNDFADIFTRQFTGLQVRGTYNWFDVGQLLQPIAPHRGFPINVRTDYEIEHAVHARVGVAAGICLGDPDVSAITRIARAPVCHGTSCLLDAGLVVAPGTWTVFNSQNTAFIRDLAPCFLMLPQLGRYDDIFSSLVAQKICCDLGWAVHFGKPFVWQQRNAHNLINDLKLEMWGSEHIGLFAKELEHMRLTGFKLSTINDMVRYVYASTGLMPYASEIASAWHAAIEVAMLATTREPVEAA